MISTRFDRSRSAWVLGVLMSTLLVPSVGRCDENGVTAAATSPDNTVGSLSEEKAPLRFSFEGVAWRRPGNSLDCRRVRFGLAYRRTSDGQLYLLRSESLHIQEAIDRINLFLLPQGFTLVRSGRLLSVINLSDPRGMQQLDALAELVAVEQLDQR